ncbi:MAG: TonB-dependent receptor plug domain-containing protein [Alistipes sp.]|nr:TonB-dependent receptor plug domain-containing protein [Alistipes sp.]
MSSILLLPHEALAEGVDTLGIYKTLDIEDISIEGNKSAPTRSAMIPTAVYDRTVDAAAPVQTMEAALRLSPSVDIRERGGKGIQTDISIRGGSFDQTMILLNGINFTDARTGHQTHSLPVDTDCISGIEIIDGITGTGAFAGAINIRTAPLKPTYLRADLSGGAYGYAAGNLSGAVTHKGLTVMAMGSYRRSDGYIHNTAFRNWNGYLRATWDNSKAGFFDFQAGYQNRLFGSNGFYSLLYKEQLEQTETMLASLRWVRSFGNLTVNASGSYRKNFDRFELIKNHPEKVPYNYHNTDNAGAELWGDYRWTAGTTSLGADYQYNHIFSTVLGEPLDTPHGRYTKSYRRYAGNLWLRHIKRWRRFDVSASAGISFTPYGNSALWSVSGGYHSLTGFGVEAGAAQSMRLPTFTDLFYTATGYKSNPDLKPERAITYRLRASYDGSEHWTASALVYWRSADNIIDWVKPTPEADWESRQITELGTLGAEISAGYRSDGWLRKATLSYGYIHSTKNSGSLISKYAFDYMRNKLAAGVEFRFLRRFSLALTGTLYDRTGNYADASGAVLDFKPYFLLDGRLSFEWRMLRLYLDAMNMTDTRYFDYGGLQMPGAWISAGITITI